MGSEWVAGDETGVIYSNLRYSNLNIFWYNVVMKNPFKYGSRVTGAAFFDRERILRDILGVVDGGNNVVLYGPRRYGKSSLVGEAMTRLRSKGWTCVELNMMDVASLEDFVSQYAKAIYREASPVVGAIRHVAGLFRRVSPKIGISDDGRPELKFEISSRKAGVDALRDVLELPAKLCPAGKTLIVLDEFQEVESLGLGMQFERTMRSVVEKQPDVAYVFLGSKTHMLERMFASPSRPFYNSAQKFLLGRPPVDESCGFVVARFKSIGITISEALAAEIVRLAGNVPYYVQAISSWVYNAVVGGKSRVVRTSDVKDAFQSLYATELILVESIFASRPESQRLLMRALAKEPTERFGEEYRDRHLLSSTSTVNTALRRLLKDSIVESLDGVYALSDPLLAYHLASK